MAALHYRDADSDYDTTSCSSSSLSTVADLSSRRSISTLSHHSRHHHKPHKANHAAWEAISLLRRSAAGGLVGLEHFRLLRRLGSGDIGNVYLCQIRNPMVGVKPSFYAMKVVDKEALAVRNKLQRAETEKEILGMLDHPFCPTLYAEFEASHFSCLVMEYCPGGDLYAARLRLPEKRFPVSSAKFYAAETLLALEYLHMMGIVYRDLKPENVLVREDGHIMLSDFDLSFKCDVVPKLLRQKTKKPEPEENNSNDEDDDRCSTPSCVTAPMIKPVLSCFSLSSSPSIRRKKITTVIRENVNSDHKVDHGYEEDDLIRNDDSFQCPEVIAEPINARSRSFVGTHEYLAPEVISGQGHGSAVDWWTFGIFLHEMLFGTTPFKGENNEKTLINILKKPLSFPRMMVNNRVEFEELMKVEDLISKLLVKNPKKRIGSLKGSVEIKRHEFFKGVNWALIRSVKPPWTPSNSRGASGIVVPKVMSKKERDAPYEIPKHRFDLF